MAHELHFVSLARQLQRRRRTFGCAERNVNRDRALMRAGVDGVERALERRVGG